MVLRHRESQLGHRREPIAEEALAESGIDPRARDDPRAVARKPFLLRLVADLLDGLGRLQAARLERRLDGVDALLDRSGADNDAIVPGHALSNPPCTCHGRRTPSSCPTAARAPEPSSP